MEGNLSPQFSTYSSNVNGVSSSIANSKLFLFFFPQRWLSSRLFSKSVREQFLALQELSGLRCLSLACIIVLLLQNYLLNWLLLPNPSSQSEQGMGFSWSSMVLFLIEIEYLSVWLLVICIFCFFIVRCTSGWLVSLERWTSSLSGSSMLYSWYSYLTQLSMRSLDYLTSRCSPLLILLSRSTCRSRWIIQSSSLFSTYELWR